MICLRRFCKKKIFSVYRMIIKQGDRYDKTKNMSMYVERNQQKTCTFLKYLIQHSPLNIVLPWCPGCTVRRIPWTRLQVLFNIHCTCTYSNGASSYPWRIFDTLLSRLKLDTLFWFIFDTILIHSKVYHIGLHFDTLKSVSNNDWW